ncbi:MAG: NAD(+)/NADH kinase [Sciscionella sp.]
MPEGGNGTTPRTATVGIITNPHSGRDIRRLVASASVFGNAEKVNMVRRVLSALAVAGVGRALLSVDLGGISAGLLRAASSRVAGRDVPWPTLEFLDGDTPTQTAADTTAAVRRMLAQGADVIVCLGGDGTARVAASACGEVPLLPLSTGTNNAFPQMREATVAGLAAGLVATGAVPEGSATRRASALEVTARGRHENALVDVCVSVAGDVGSRALWHPAELRELYCTFAESDGIGLSSIPGLLRPSPRDEPQGVELLLCPPERAAMSVYAPVAPGLVCEVGVASIGTMEVGATRTVGTPAGVVAVDGEREIEFGCADTVTVTLSDRGPRVIDIGATLRMAAERGLLAHHRDAFVSQ